MNNRNLLTVIGGLCASVSPILLSSTSENLRLVGGILGAVGGVLLGQRGFERDFGTSDRRSPVDRDDGPTIPAEVPDLQRVVIHRIAGARSYPEQDLAPKLYDSKEAREKAFQEWRAQNGKV